MSDEMAVSVFAGMFVLFGIVGLAVQELFLLCSSLFAWVNHGFAVRAVTRRGA